MEDGREIFDDADEEYEVQTDTKKRKSLQNKKGKLLDEPASKRKSLKNFFSAKEKKEKESASTEEDNLLKNILEELDGNNTNAGSSASAPLIAPKSLKSIRKQETDSEIEIKNYMNRFGKKVNEKKSKETNGDVSAKKILKTKLI